jgi:hypothetical protein
MSQPHEHPITAAPEHPALVVMGCPSLKHCRGQCGSFISTGAEIRALKQVGGGDCNPLLPSTCELRESVVVHGPSDHGDDATCHNLNASPHK